MSFENAWSLAIMGNRPRSNVEKEIVGSVKGYCDDAWHERRPALRSFSLQMLRANDGARQARSSGAWRVETMVAA